jgi:hypothetical protein
MILLILFMAAVLGLSIGATVYDARRPAPVPKGGARAPRGLRSPLNL